MNRAAEQIPECSVIGWQAVDKGDVEVRKDI